MYWYAVVTVVKFGLLSERWRCDTRLFEIIVRAGRLRI